MKMVKMTLYDATVILKILDIVDENEDLSYDEIEEAILIVENSIRFQYDERRAAQRLRCWSPTDSL